MKSTNLYELYYDEVLSSREEVYTFIAQKYAQSKQQVQDIYESLVAREKDGNIEIAPHVLLPHSEMEDFPQSKISIIRLKKPIFKWSEQLKEVQLIILILLKQGETVEMKREITSFMRKLAEEEYIAQLLNAQNEQIVEVLIKNRK